MHKNTISPLNHLTVLPCQVSLIFQIPIGMDIFIGKVLSNKPFTFLHFKAEQPHCTYACDVKTFLAV